MRLGTAIGGVFWSVLGSELLSLQEEEELWLFAVEKRDSWVSLALGCTRKKVGCSGCLGGVNSSE